MFALPKTVYFGTWDRFEDIAGDFQLELDSPEMIAINRVLYARYSEYYGYGSDYEMWAEVLYIGHDGLLYEVHGSHCSCYGLEGQWEPDLVTAADVLTTVRYDDENNKYNAEERAAMLAGLVAYQPGILSA
jgi:hypothetical protein